MQRSPCHFDASQDPPDDIPLQHLRAAEQHLAALERWLRGEGKGVDNAG